MTKKKCFCFALAVFILGICSGIGLSAVYVYLYFRGIGETPIVHMDDYKGGFVRNYGVYKIKQDGYVINVDKDPDGILIYQVYDSSGNLIIESNEKASVYQRWFLFWDKDDNLWVHSSDVGCSVWRKKDLGLYVNDQCTPDSAAVYKSMPDEVFERMPESVRTKWRGERYR
jgi:hypothetical protein